MEMVTNEIGKFAKKHEERLLHHVNVEAIQLLDNSELVRRLKKNLLSWCSDHQKQSTVKCAINTINMRQKTVHSVSAAITANKGKDNA
jgi:hypothetical protein